MDFQGEYNGTMLTLHNVENNFDDVLAKTSPAAQLGAADTFQVDEQSSATETSFTDSNVNSSQRQQRLRDKLGTLYR